MAGSLEEIDPEAIDDADNPELTEADFARGRPFAELFPEQARTLRTQGGRPKLARPKVKVAWRLSADVVDHVRQIGRGSTARVDAILKDAIAKGTL